LTVKILRIQKFEAFVEWKYLNTSQYYGDFIQTPEDNPSFRILAKKRLFAKFEQISKNTAIIILISMRRWQCSIYNSTLEILIWSKMWKIKSFFWFENCSIPNPDNFFSLSYTSKKCASHFCREATNQNK